MGDVPSDGIELDEEIDETAGAGTARARRTVTGDGNVELGEQFGEATVRAAAWWSDDEPPHVHLRTTVAGVTMTATLGVEEARRLSAQLRSAATHAVQGQARLRDKVEE
jgi:hypothetical protein